MSMISNAAITAHARHAGEVGSTGLLDIHIFAPPVASR